MMQPGPAGCRKRPGELLRWCGYLVPRAVGRGKASDRGFWFGSGSGLVEVVVCFKLWFGSGSGLVQEGFTKGVYS